MAAPPIVSSLPSRPLTTEEGEALADQETDLYWVRPESIVVTDDGDRVIALGAVNRDAGRMYLVGFDPATESWMLIDEWEEADLGHDGFYERLEAWEDEHYDLDGRTW